MNRVKLLATRLFNTYLFKNIYVCPICPEKFGTWDYSRGYCPRCGRELVKQDNRFNLCPQCGTPKLDGDFCKMCGHAFMRIRV